MRPPQESSSPRTKGELARVRKEIRERMVGYIAGAFGLVAGLAWNDAISALIEHLFPVAKNTLLAKFAYALILTSAVAAITMYLVRLFKEDE